MNRALGYAVLAVGHIAREKESPTNIKAEAISETYGIPEEYLQKVMKQLAKAGILTSKRGPGGGFGLARPAKKITLLEVLRAVKEPVQDLGLPRVDSYCREATKFYEQAKDAMLKILAKTTIVSLLG